MEKRYILKYCRWNGLEIPCSAIFSTFPTERGMCCSFNMKAAEDIFIGDTYSKVIQDLQNYDKNISFDGANLPLKYVQNGEPRTQPGIEKGLTVVLDAHADLLSAGSVEVDNKGFVGLIQQSGSFPTSLNSFDIKPGHKNTVSMTGTVIRSSPELKNLATTGRKCLFNEEHDLLKLHKKYTQSNCLFECAIYYAQKTMKKKYNKSCIPWHFPSSETKPKICNPWEGVEFVELMSNVPRNECQNCLPDCSLTIYKFSVTAVPLRNCSFSNLNVIQFCKVNSTMSNIGGILGLVLGISLVTVAELVWLFTYF